MDVLGKDWFILNNGIATGSACFIAPGTYKIKGAGDMARFTDKFRYVYKSFSGNGTVTVRVTQQDAANALNKAGIMFRESLVSGSDYALLALSSGNGVFFQAQTHSGISLDADNTGAGTIKAPYWLRLERNGSSFTAWVSKDSITWTSIGKKTVPSFSKNVYVGLAVSSHSNNALSEAIFDSWTITDKTGPGSNGSILPGWHPLVFPNPSLGHFILDFNIEKKQRVWITITSGADGRTCYIETLNDFLGNYHRNLDALRLAKGSYAVTVRTEDGTQTIMLIRQ
jgi:regulation of enolase protein 1 (concanavalin A-like superfamily)